MKVLIADDEPLVRRGIISLLEGYADVELAGEVSNGLAAQEFIKNNPVDVVFVDIRMPKVDGIELLKWLMAYYPHIKSVVLSSYQDFDYVKKAFLFGAQDYIAKHEIDEQTMAAVLQKVRFACKQKGVGNDGGIYRLLFHGEVPAEPGKPKSGVVICCVADAPGEAWKSAVCELGAPWCEQDGRLYLLYQPEVESMFVQRIRQAAGVSLSVGISDREGMRDARKLRVQAETALEQRFFEGPGKTMRYAPPRIDASADRIAAIRKSIASKILEKCTASLTEELNALFLLLRSSRQISETQTRLMYVSLADLLVLKFGGDSPALRDAEALSKPIMDAPFLEDIHRLVLDAVSGLVDSQTDILDMRACSGVIRQVIRYINSGFSMCDLGLDTAAKEFGYSPTYLSRLFKNETGVSLIDYVNMVRIHNAKKLLDTPGRKAYEVAKTVGYNNYNYFSRNFKKITGYTISEYRENAEH
jgi:two-component system response regulator YesN